MRLLKNTDVNTLPASLVDHLITIKTLVQVMNPGLRDGYISDMLNSALKKRVSTVGTKAFILDLATDNFNEALIPGLKVSLPDKRFTQVLKHQSGQAFLTNQVVMLLLEDGLHPLASLSGWNLHAGIRKDVTDQSGFDHETDRLLFPHREHTNSPFYECALLMLEDTHFLAAFPPQRAARQLHRFALQLSKENDLLAMLHTHFFTPRGKNADAGRKAISFSRPGPIEHRLLWALGRIIDLAPELDTGRIGEAKWPHAIINRWVRNGLISELPANLPIASFVDDLERYPNCITPMAIRSLAYHDQGHPLRETIEQGYISEVLTNRKCNNHSYANRQDAEAFTKTHHYEVSFQPELAKRVGTDYFTVHKEQFMFLWQFCDLEVIDYILADLATAWGHPLPSQDPALIGLSFWSRHPQWFENVKDRLPDIIEPYLQNKSVLPPGLLGGSIPLSIIPQHLVERFVLTIMDKQLPKVGFDRIEELLDAKRLAPEFLVKHANPRDLTGALPGRYVQDHILDRFVSHIFKARLTDIGFKRIRELLDLNRITQDLVIERCPHEDLTKLLPVAAVPDHLIEPYVASMLEKRFLEHEFDVVKYLTDHQKIPVESIVSGCDVEDLEAMAFRGILKADILNSPRVSNSLRVDVLEKDLGL